MKHARKVALNSPSRFKVGAVLIRGSNIIGSGCNYQKKTHPSLLDYYPTTDSGCGGLHAEQAACRGLRPYDISRGDLYVYRVLNTGVQGLAKPCKGCVAFLKDKKVSKVYYSLNKKGYGDLKI